MHRVNPTTSSPFLPQTRLLFPSLEEFLRLPFSRVRACQKDGRTHLTDKPISPYFLPLLQT